SGHRANWSGGENCWSHLLSFANQTQPWRLWFPSLARALFQVPHRHLPPCWASGQVGGGPARLRLGRRTWCCHWHSLREAYRRAQQPGSAAVPANLAMGRLPPARFTISWGLTIAQTLTPSARPIWRNRRWCILTSRVSRLRSMSMLLNSAFDVLRDPEKRSVYDASLNNDNQEHFEEHEDTGPTWAWMPKDTRKPVYQGRPRSRSLWDRVPEKNRGEKWEQQRFLFVDELRCILCWNCIECAPKSFCMDADHLRARVYAQWGNCEDDLTWAVKSCPVEIVSPG
ncbi:unnamed protein product, partial [Effrenium voratum]